MNHLSKTEIDISAVRFRGRLERAGTTQRSEEEAAGREDVSTEAGERTDSELVFLRVKRHQNTESSLEEALANPLPRMVTIVPAVPDTGSSEEMTGSGCTSCKGRV